MCAISFLEVPQYFCRDFDLLLPLGTILGVDLWMQWYLDPGNALSFVLSANMAELVEQVLDIFRFL